MAASLACQTADLSARWTRTLVTLVRLPFVVVTDGRYFARFVARRRSDSFPRAARHRYLAAAASALYNVGSVARVARSAVAGSGAFVFTAIERLAADPLAKIDSVLRRAVATLSVAQVSTA